MNTNNPSDFIAPQSSPVSTPSAVTIPPPSILTTLKASKDRGPDGRFIFKNKAAVNKGRPRVKRLPTEREIMVEAIPDQVLVELIIGTVAQVYRGKATAIKEIYEFMKAPNTPKMARVWAIVHERIQASQAM